MNHKAIYITISIAVLLSIIGVCSLMIILAIQYSISEYIPLVQCNIYKASVEAKYPKPGWPVVQYYPTFYATYKINNRTIDGKGTIVHLPDGVQYKFIAEDELRKYISVSSCFVNKSDMNTFVIGPNLVMKAQAYNVFVWITGVLLILFAISIIALACIKLQKD